MSPRKVTPKKSIVKKKTPTKKIVGRSTKVHSRSVQKSFKSKKISSTKSAIKSRISRRKKKITMGQRVKAWSWLVFIMVISFLVALPSWRALEVYSQVVQDNDGDVSIGTLLKEGLQVVKNEPLKGEEEGRTNFLLLGLRGEDDPYGGLLTDTIMLVSYHYGTEEVSMVSIPRDLYVKIPDYNNYVHKINSVHWIGEKEETGGGLEYMKKTVSSILDEDIHYVVRVDMTAYKKTIRMLGGVDVYLEEPFIESKQFKGYVFKLDAGWNHLDEEEAFAFAQARYSTSDFDRARRQQQLIEAIKNKAAEMKLFKNVRKIDEMMGIVGDHVTTDVTPSEMYKLLDVFEKVDLENRKSIVFDDAPGGFLYSTYVGNAYALRPVGNDFTRMQEAVENIFEESTEDEDNEEDVD